MNFYKHHLGDYAAGTSHLSWDEDCAYRRLLDQYYKREEPLPCDLKEVFRLARASSQVQRRAIVSVLKEFFLLQEDGWHQKRCDGEIVVANAQAYTNRRIAAEREAKRRTRTVHESYTKSQNDSLDGSCTNRSPVSVGEREPPQTPDSRLQTNTSEANASGGKPPLPPDEIIFGYGVPLLTAAGSTDKSARSFLGGLRKGHGDGALVDALRDCLKAKPLQPLEWLAAALPPKGSARNGNHSGETVYQRSMRERMQAVCPSIAAKNPNQKPTAEVFDVSSRSLDR